MLILCVCCAYCEIRGARTNGLWAPGFTSIVVQRVFFNARKDNDPASLYVVVLGEERAESYRPLRNRQADEQDGRFERQACCHPKRGPKPNAPVSKINDAFAYNFEQNLPTS